MQGMLVKTNPLKHKFRVGIIIDYFNDYTSVNGVWYFFPIFSLFSLQDCIFQIAKCAT